MTNDEWRMANDEVASAPKVQVRRIWDRAPHNAFTDLIRFRNHWFCVFREGQGHVSPDGALRVLTSREGDKWESAALITRANADLRDAKISVTPQGRLMLLGAGALHQPHPHRHQTMAWFSRDGKEWSEPCEIGDLDVWLWRVTWHERKALGIGYGTVGDHFIRLYESYDGKSFKAIVPRLFDQGQPNETSIIFPERDRALCVLRRDGSPSGAMLGESRAPFVEWKWRDLGVRIGGPHVLRLPDGRYVVAGRRYDGKVRTSLMWLDRERAQVTEFLVLPSGGDTSYPGLVWHRNELWVSYYSSHEEKTCIYLARVGLE